MALPDLSVAITAKTDGFETSLQRASKAAEDASRNIQGSTDKINAGFGILKGAVEGLVGALTINAFVGLIKGAIDSADHLNDLSKKTGLAVETLGGFGFAAEQAGGSLDSVAKGLVKLDLSLSQAAAGNAKAREGFDLLGVSVKNIDGSTRSASQVLPELADKFASFNDGPEKAALAVRLFGKAGADLIPVLDDGGKKLLENVDYYQRYSGVTQDLAEKSDQFNDTLTKIGLLSGAFGKTLAGELLPTLQTLADLFVESKEKGTAFRTVAETIAEVFKALVIATAEVAFAFGEAGRELGAFGAKLTALAHLDFKGYSAISDALREDQKTAEKDLAAFRARISNPQGQPATAGAAAGPATKTDAPRLKSTAGGKGPTVDLDKKLLDQNLKDLDIYIAQEKERYTDRTTFLQLDYQRNRISLSDYFDGRQQARDVDLKNTQAAYDKEIQAERDYIAKQNAADPKGQAKIIDANTKIAELQEKSRKAGHDAAIEEVKDTNAREVALEQYGDQLSGLQAQIASLRGDTAKSFTISFDIQNRNLSEKIDASLKSSDPSTRQAAEAAKENLASIRQQGLVQAALNDQEQQRTKILLELQNAQERVNLAVSSGKKTELEGLADLSAANRARIADLQKVIDAEQAIAESSKDPAALARVDALRVELEKLSEQTDLVADKFRAIGESATENFLNKLTDGTGKVKDAFKALVKDLNSELLKVGNKEIAQQLFKKDGPLGGLFGSLGGLFGGSAGGTAKVSGTAAGTTGAVAGAADTAANGDAFKTLAGTVGGTDSALSSLSVTTPVLDAAFSSLTASSTALSIALDAAASSAGGGAASGAGDALLSSGLLNSAKGNAFSAGNVIPFARGDIFSSPTLFPMAGGKIGQLGEAGPEAIVPLMRGRDGKLGIASSGGGAPGDSINQSNNFYFAAPPSRQSQGQIVQAASRALTKRQRSRSA